MPCRRSASMPRMIRSYAGCPARVDPLAVALRRPVDAHADPDPVLGEELAPGVVDQRGVGLHVVLDTRRERGHQRGRDARGRRPAARRRATPPRTGRCRGPLVDRRRRPPRPPRPASAGRPPGTADSSRRSRGCTASWAASRRSWDGRDPAHAGDARTLPVPPPVHRRMPHPRSGSVSAVVQLQARIARCRLSDANVSWQCIELTRVSGAGSAPGVLADHLHLAGALDDLADLPGVHAAPGQEGQRPVGVLGRDDRRTCRRPC